MIIKKILDLRQQRELENLKAENEELRVQLQEQSDALTELAELIEGGEKDG